MHFNYNLSYIKKWYLFYSKLDETKIQQVVGKLTNIPWGSNIVIITKCNNLDEAIYYVGETIENNWSRSVLVHQIESKLYQRDEKSINNFDVTLPKINSDLENETLKDPYVFDFLTMTKNYSEKELENNLVKEIKDFLLELGAGFAFLGNQVPIQVGDREFFLDLLFYHTKLHCYVVVELKITDFEPEYAGKLNFYAKAVDEIMKDEKDDPTIGLLLCKNKDKLVAEYALSDVNKPIGISEYKLTNKLPEKLKDKLPTIEELEEEFREK